VKHQNDFCVFILSHGRPASVVTVNTIKKFGYTGNWYIILDDFDQTIDEYKKRFGENKIIVFDKAKVMNDCGTDAMDNFHFHKSSMYARNVCTEIAKDLGYKYYAEYEDDYDSIRWRMNPEIEYSSKMLSTNSDHHTLDRVFDVMIDYLAETPRLQSVCMAQSGDYIGGGDSRMSVDQYRRKVMNSWIIDVDRPFSFSGTMNEDVNCYTTLTSRGVLFLTTGFIAINQKQTQSSGSGNTDMYKKYGTYVKSFYSIIGHPSGVKIAALFNTSARKASGPKTNDTFRVHHRVTWGSVAPLILRENIKKD
jgi:hypothetical protein